MAAKGNFDTQDLEETIGDLISWYEWHIMWYDMTSYEEQHLDRTELIWRKMQSHLAETIKAAAQDKKTPCQVFVKDEEIFGFEAV